MTKEEEWATWVQRRRIFGRTSTRPAPLSSFSPAPTQNPQLGGSVQQRQKGSALINKVGAQWLWMGGSLMLAGSEGDVYRGACQMVARGCSSVCGSCWGEMVGRVEGGDRRWLWCLLCSWLLMEILWSAPSQQDCGCRHPHIGQGEQELENDSGLHFLPACWRVSPREQACVVFHCW